MHTYVNEEDVIKEIDEKVSFYRAWSIGVTSDPVKRRLELDSHRNIVAWYH